MKKENMPIATKLAEIFIKKQDGDFTPITFDCLIRVNGNYNTECVTMCYCTEKEMETLMANPSFDDTIFFYIVVGENPISNLFNEEDFEIVDVYEESVQDVLWV